MQKVNNEGTTEHVLEFSQGFSATHFKVFVSVRRFFPDFFRISSYRSLHLLIKGGSYPLSFLLHISFARMLDKTYRLHILTTKYDQMPFQGKSSLKKHLGFFQSSHSEKAASKEPG
jgi:hypothetical protein